MRWSCPHCKADLSLNDALIGGGWTISRCSSCEGHALMKAAEVSLIKLDRVPKDEPILLAEPAAGVAPKPTVKPAQPRAKASEPQISLAPIAKVAPISAGIIVSEKAPPIQQSQPVALQAAALVPVEFSPWSPPAAKKTITIPERPASLSPPPPPPAVLVALPATRELEKKPPPVEKKVSVTVRPITTAQDLAFFSDPAPIQESRAPHPKPNKRKHAGYFPALASFILGISLLGAHTFFTHALRSAESIAASLPLVAAGTISPPALLAHEVTATAAANAVVPAQAMAPGSDQVHLAAMAPQREPAAELRVTRPRLPVLPVLVETITDKVYLRSGPSQKFRRLGFARNDFRYSVTGKSNDWLKVEVPGQPGPSAWIHSDFVHAVTD